jgi:hypothetical protein
MPDQDDGDDQLLALNGISGVSGGYAVQPISARQAVWIASRERADAGERQRAQALQALRDASSFGWPDEVDIKDPAQAGWALVIHEDEDPQVRAALDALWEHRRAQIPADRALRLEVKRGETDHVAWLSRHGVGVGTAEPTLVPYYLLVVGSPQLISFRFSQGLAQEYGPGRLHFDSPGAYAAYVRGLIAYESGGPPRSAKELAFFATRHPLDFPTQRAYKRLVLPLAGLDDDSPAALAALAGKPTKAGFAQRVVLGDAATKANLRALLAPGGAARPPALLFTSGHGMVFPRDDAQQRARQGALLCQDWPGPGSIDPSMYFSADDLPADAQLGGMIAFFFACFGGGTPLTDRFFGAEGAARSLAAAPFMAALPQAMLSHPNGGALACIGHIDRAWASSFRKPGIATQLTPFQRALDRIQRGWPIGYALKDFRDRYTQLSTELSKSFEQLETNKIIGAATSAAQWAAGSDDGLLDSADLAAEWVERNDSEGYLVIGDPAARLRFSH